MKTLRLIAPACLLLAACVSSGPESQIGKQDKAPKRIEMSRTSDCVFQSTIEDFDALDDRYVVLYAIGPAQGLPCRNLRRLLRRQEPDRRSPPSTATATGRSAASAATRSPTNGSAWSRTAGSSACKQLSDERRLELGLAVPQPKPRKEKKVEDAPEKKPGEP